MPEKFIAKRFSVSSDVKIFVVLRSILAAAFVSLLIFFLYFFLSKSLLIPIILILVAFNSWLFYLTAKELSYLANLSLVMHETYLEFGSGAELTKLTWKEIKRIEMTYTPVGTRNTYTIHTRDKSYPLHIYAGLSILWEELTAKLAPTSNVVSYVKIWGKEMQLLLATIFSFFALVLLAMMIVQPTDFSFIYFVVLTAGLFFILYRPFSQLITEAITQAEVGLGTICVLAFMLHFTATLLLPYLQRSQVALAACGSESAQVMCYRTQPETCKRLWTQLETTCKEELRPTLQARSPSSLVGPIISRCQKQKFDKSLFYSRINASSDVCQSYFSNIEKFRR